MGQITYKFEISGVMCGNNKYRIKECIDRCVGYVMVQLPFDTKLISIEELGVYNLSIPYIATFEHPGFVDGAEIKNTTQWKRDICIDKQEEKIYAVDINDNFNWDDFLNKEYKDEK
jgi:hypothetical protein